MIAIKDIVEEFQMNKENAKIHIDEMIDKMGLDAFVDFYDVAFQIVNRRKLTRDEIKNLIEVAPRGMYYVLEMARVEMVATDDK